ncbi:MAG: hypothetical protein JXR29_02285 [Methylothermaceae bacterium]|nr:hypothetical protein [Methylothermaceae bacterium]
MTAKLEKIFLDCPSPSPAFLKTLARQAEPRSRFIVAITPRSGSSYLCDMMKKTGRFGRPDEYLNANFLPGILTKIPAEHPGDYLRHVVKMRKTGNGVSGLKASWFQFRNFIACLPDLRYIKGFRFIYLTRRDLAMQAVSLYKATATDVFHTNIRHDEAKLTRLESLEYDFNQIHEWYRHIELQEAGWRHFFYRHRIFPLCITYEEVEADVLAVMKRIATFVAVDPDNVRLPAEASVFRKVRDERNLEWSRRFILERAGLSEHPPL